MDTDSRTDELVMRIANFLRGRVDAEALPYVSAEIAYLMSQMGNRSINDESEFYDFVNGLDCSLMLGSWICGRLFAPIKECSRMTTVRMSLPRVRSILA